MYKLVVLTVLILASIGAFAQAADTPYQVRYAANLDKKDSVMNLSNTGANGAPLTGPGSGGPGGVGNICANVYVFAPDAQLIECCSCQIQPNSLESFSVKNDLISNVLQGSTPPTSVEVALLGTLPIGGSCSNSASNVAAGATIVQGLVAWMATNHATVTVTPGQYWWQPSTTTTTTTFDETAFTPSTLSAGELASLANRCQNIVGNGSGFGICRSCRLGGQ
jgi:hypothetical protein